MSAVHRGGCLCGSVRFELVGDFDSFYVCHCARCRKHSGSAFASNLFASDLEVRWLAGEDALTRFQLEGTRFSRTFCADCGSSLPNVRGPSNVMIPAGCLETDVDLVPRAHIFIGSRANWEDCLEGVPKYDELPTQ